MGSTVKWVISWKTTAPPPTPMNFVHGSYMEQMDIVGHVAGAPAP